MGCDDDAVLDILRRIWGARVDRYSELRAKKGGDDEKIEMYQIGG